MFGPKIKLDRELIERCKKYAEQAGYSSVEEFVAHTLEKELMKGGDSESDRQQQDIRNSLKGLGYID